MADALERIAAELKTSNELKRRFIEWMFQDLNGDIKTIAAALEKMMMPTAKGKAGDVRWVPRKIIDYPTPSPATGESWQIGDHEFDELEAEE